MPRFTGHGTSATTGSTCHEAARFAGFHEGHHRSRKKPVGVPEDLPLRTMGCIRGRHLRRQRPADAIRQPLAATALGEENRAEATRRRFILTWHAFLIASWTRVWMWNHEG